MVPSNLSGVPSPKKPLSQSSCALSCIGFSRFCLRSEIFCIKAGIAACSNAVSNLGPVHTYEQSEKVTENSCETEYERIQGEFFLTAVIVACLISDENYTIHCQEV